MSDQAENKVKGLSLYLFFFTCFQSWVSLKTATKSNSKKHVCVLT